MSMYPSYCEIILPGEKMEETFCKKMFLSACIVYDIPPGLKHTQKNNDGIVKSPISRSLSLINLSISNLMFLRINQT